MDMDAILEAHMGGEASEEEEEEAGMGPAAAEGPDVEGELGVNVLFYDLHVVHAVHAGLGLLEKASFMCVAISQLGSLSACFGSQIGDWVLWIWQLLMHAYKSTM